MQRKHKQLRMDASAEFYDFVTHERAERGLSLQWLMVRALERYLDVPEPLHQWLDRISKLSYAQPNDGMKPGTIIRLALQENLEEIEARFQNKRSAAQLAQAVQKSELERDKTIESLVSILEQMPADKLNTLLEMLQVDFRSYRSSRLSHKKGSPS